MPRPCKACIHPQRADIDAAIGTGVPYRDIAGQFHLSKSCVERHAAHIKAVVQKARTKRERRNVKNAKTIRERFDVLVEQATQGLENAKTDRDKQGWHVVLARWFDLAYKLGMEEQRRRAEQERRGVGPEVAAKIDEIMEKPR
jgi:hypothetical protein